MIPTVALQWVGTIVVIIIVVVLTIIILRLLWTVASRQWTKYNKINNRVKAIETALYGNQSQYTGHSIAYMDYDVRYKISDNCIYTLAEEHEWKIKNLQTASQKLTQQIADLQSYRPTNIENPDDLK